jgi:hypothetical protein
VVASDAIAPQLAVAAHGGEVACIPDVAPPMNSMFVVPAAPCDPGQAPLPSTPLQRASATPQIVDDALQIADAPQVALACVPGSSPPPGAAQHLVDDSVIPKYPAHVLALRELPASAAQRAIPLLEAVIKRRRAHVHQVLRNHAVPDELCDPYNLTCGLRGGRRHAPRRVPTASMTKSSAPTLALACGLYRSGAGATLANASRGPAVILRCSLRTCATLREAGDVFRGECDGSTQRAL